MTRLESKFDVDSRDPHHNAQAGLLVVLRPNVIPAVTDPGTPAPGNFDPGHVVAMDGNGKAELAVSPDLVGAPELRKLMFVTIDGDKDYDGAFVHALTCINGGMEIVTDKFVAGAYTPGQPLMVGVATPGSFEPLPAASTRQQYGFVGDRGYDATENVLHVIIPQG